METSSLKLIKISELKIAKDLRAYYTAEFQDKLNPFAKSCSRTFFQQIVDGEAVWKGADYAVVAKFVGNCIPASIITKHVEDYTIGDKTVNTYTTVIFAGELEAVVFKSCGHPIASEQGVNTVIKGNTPDNVEFVEEVENLENVTN